MNASERRNFLHGMMVAIIFLASSLFLPIIYALKMPDVVTVFHGIAFLTIGNYFMVKRKQFFESIICCLLSVIAIVFGMLELFKTPIFSDGFNVYTFIIIIIIVLLVLSVAISIMNIITKNKKLEYLPAIFSGIAIFLYAIIIEFIYSFIS